MFFIIGTLVVLGCVLGGYLGGGGHFEVLIQPLEWLIIFGAATGAYITGNPKTVLMGTIKAMTGPLLKGPKYSRADYLELMGCLYAVFKLAKTKGDLALESHVEKPSESTLFQKFPKFASDHHTVEYFCDYLRLLTLGTSNSHEVEAVIDAELEQHHNEQHAISASVQTAADGMPALGIVAAVLGVIHTMGSITEPPEVLGHLIGAALVGTFMGVLISYGFVAPIATNIASAFDSDSKYMLSIKVGLLAHMQGYAPQVSVEFARKVLASDKRPSFAEVEEYLQNIPPD